MPVAPSPRPATSTSASACTTVRSSNRPARSASAVTGHGLRQGWPSGVGGRGIEIATATTKVTAVDGVISLVGDGATGAGSDHQGIIVFDGIISSTGTGASAATITATGTGNSVAGIWLNSANAKVLSTAGAVSVTGTVVGTAAEAIVLIGSAPSAPVQVH